MLTPLALDADYDRVPVAVLLLIVLMGLGTYAYETFDRATIETLALNADAFRPRQIATSMLLHGGVLHFLLNALYLWVFGRYLEDRLGPIRFLVLFLVFEAAGDAAWLLRGGEGLAIGASGAIAGCMGLVLFTAPKAAILTKWWFGLRVRVRRLPVWFLLGLWILTQLWIGVRVAAGGEMSVAYQAHLGGFLAGCLSSWVLRSAWLEGTGWYLPRAPHGGERLKGAYGEMMQGEATWRTIEEHLARRNDEPTDTTSDASPAPEPKRRSRGLWD